MSSYEEKLRVLLSRAGFPVSNSTIVQAFRQDAALSEVLPWIVENVTEANYLEPQLRQDAEELQGRFSLPNEAGQHFHVLFKLAVRRNMLKHERNGRSGSIQTLRT